MPHLPAAIQPTLLTRPQRANGKIYVGQTSGIIERRWNSHLLDAKHGDNQPKLNRAIRKYGSQSFKVICLEKVSNAMLNEREIFWIAKLNTYKNGYNCTLGGEGQPKYDKDYICGLWDSGLSFKEIASKVGCTRHHVYEVLQGHDGYSKEESKLRGAHNRRQVCQYGLNGEYIQTFESIAEAAAMFHVSATTLCAACRKKIPSVAGFQWRYCGDATPAKYVDNQKKRKPVGQYDSDGKFIKAYESCNVAHRATGISASSISACCKQKAKTAGGFLWKYS